MAAEGGGQVMRCGVCGTLPPSIRGMKQLRCGHGMCAECSATNFGSRHPDCRECSVSIAGISRPQSFAELTLEASLISGHSHCQEKAESCLFVGQATKCHHCSLYLCSEHLQRHGQMVMKSAEDDVRKLMVMKQSIVQQTSVEKSSAGGDGFKAFKERAESQLDKLSKALHALNATVRQPIDAYEKQILERSQLRNKVLGEADTMLEQLQATLTRGNPEEVLNTQRKFQYLNSSGTYNLPAQQGGAPIFGLAQDNVAAIEAQFSAVMSALQGLQEIVLPTRRDNEAASNDLSAVAGTNEQLASQSASSCFVDGATFVTRETPLDVGCYSVQDEPLVLFVIEANSDESRVTLRSYTEPAMNSQEVPLAFIRSQQLITTFQPRRIAVMTVRKQIAMTDRCSTQYYRHIFTCDFTGQSGHKVFKIERAKRLDGIHASGNQVYACDTADCSVFILDCSENLGRHVRVACGESVPSSVSTWDALWMLVAFDSNVKLFSLQSLQQVCGVEAERPPVTRERGTRESIVYINSLSAEPSQTPAASGTQKYRDIAHVSNEVFAVAMATSLLLYSANMTPIKRIGEPGPDSTPGPRFGDLVGMCAAQRGGKTCLFLCDRGLQRISVIQL